jgi:hypothetical protein
VISAGQHGILRENFAVHLGDQMILASCVMAPDLSEFDALNGHKISFSSQSTHPAAKPSIAAELPLWDRPASCGLRF